MRFNFIESLTSSETFRRLALMLVVAAVGIGVLGVPQRAFAQSRIKDIADFEGVRPNLLVGYGLVVGLDGTGDTLTNSAFTQHSLVGMLERLGVNTSNDTLKTKNVAAVMVTGRLPAFARQGTEMDVTVSALGDAKSLRGGTLLVTPMVGADGEVYAVAQGQLVIGGFTASGNAASITKNVPTSGRIPNGAIVERELHFDMSKMHKIAISLRNPDLTTARRVADAINNYLNLDAATPDNPATVTLKVPPSYPGGPVALLTDIEQLRVRPDEVARVVIDENTGVIVMGENVRISTVAIAQGNLTIQITETKQVSQPNAFSSTGTTQTVDRTKISVNENKNRKLALMPSGVSLQSVVNGLNALGVGPRDMISILQAIKAAGALQADIEVI